MRNIILFCIFIISFGGCAAEKKYWVNYNIPHVEHSVRFYQTLNFCQGVANGAYPPGATLEQYQNNNTAVVYPSNNAPIQAGAYNVSQALQNFSNAHARYAEAYRRKEMQNNCMRAHGWMLTTVEEDAERSRNFQYQATRQNITESASTNSSPTNTFVEMKTFYADLADTNKSRTIKLDINLEFKNFDYINEFDKNEASIRKAINTILTSKKYAEVSSGEGKVQLRRDITTAINKVLQNDAVLDVYYRDIVIE